MTELWERGELLTKWPDFQKTEDWCRIVICTKGKLFYAERLPVLFEVYDPYYAFGSGRDFALGAMAVGADAIRAVEATCRHSTECSGEPVWFEVAS
jgi:hypothetical protein